MTTPAALPDLYRLLAVFSGLPLKTLPALEAAGLRVPVTDPRDPQDPGRAEITDYHRGLLRILTRDGRVRWVEWGPDGPGYVLTGIGEAALDIYARQYGPAHSPRRAPPLGPLARHRVRVKRGLEAPDPDIDPEVPRLAREDT